MPTIAWDIFIGSEQISATSAVYRRAFREIPPDPISEASFVSAINRWRPTFGFEYTFVPSEELLLREFGEKARREGNKFFNGFLYNKFLHYTLEKLDYSEEFNLIKKPHPSTRYHIDMDCIEINSPWWTTKPPIIKFYKRIKTFMAHHSFVEFGDDWNALDGGCHAHVGLQNLLKTREAYFAVQTAIMSLWLSRPSLTWAFGDWWDDINFNVVYYSRALEDLKTSIAKVNEEGLIRARTDTVYDTKDHPVGRNNAGKTLEFRAFCMPRSDEEFEAVLDFLIAMCDWAKKKAIDSFPKVTEVNNVTKAQVKKYKLTKAKREFNQTLEELGLDTKNYEVFVKRNLVNRFKEGKLI